MKHPTTRVPRSPSSLREEQVVLERRRLKAGKLFENRTKQAEIARKLKVTRAAVHYWYTAWKKKGKAGLVSQGHRGNGSWLTEAKKRQVEQALLQGPQSFGYGTDLWTLDRITKVIKQVANVCYAPRSAWHVLGVLGWSCQKPERRSRERDEHAIAYWKKMTWPAIKKRG